MLSDAIIISLVNTVIGALLAIVLKWMANRAARDAREAKRAAQEVAKAVSTVKEDLKESTSATAQELVTIREVGEKTLITGEKTHSIVNSERTQMLRFSAVLARRVANLSDHKEDDVVAKAAEELYRKNLEAQPKPVEVRKAGNVFAHQPPEG